MSQGMWTKQLTAEGLAFFYNSSLDQSVWHPPEDRVVHIAPYLGFQFQQVPLSVYDGSFASTNQIDPSSNFIDNVNSEKNSKAISNNSTCLNTNMEINHESAKKKSLAKRFNANAGSSDEISAKYDNNESSYLRQKAELEAMMGCKKDDTAKWLVR